MKKEIADRWVEALRSGEYKQTTNKLRDKNGFCCLGVLCDVVAKDMDIEWKEQDSKDYPYTFNGACGVLPGSVLMFTGLKHDDGSYYVDGVQKNHLPSLNDNGYKFDYIADVIEKNWEKM